MTDFEFENILKNDISLIERRLIELLPDCKDGQDEVCEAMEYSLSNGGKRIRPVLTLEFARACGADRYSALDAACAVEYIHTYSLIHDDLPCMDNADTRRGKPSCHKMFGEAKALLAGDALLNTAFEIMAEECENGGSGALKAMRHIARSAGANGMINGQVRDLKLSERKDADEDKLVALIEQKTMAMIMTGIISAAYLSEADEEAVKSLEEFAYNIGIAFQIRDDFEDEGEDAESAQNSPNFINILGRDKALEKMTLCKNRALSIINAFENNTFIKNLTEYLFD